MKKLTVILLALAMLCTCFALAACGDDGDTSSADSSAASSANSSAASSASSSKPTSSGSSSAASSSAASSATSSAASSEASSAASSAAASTSSEEEAAQAKPMWVTHYNDPISEGAGVIMTEPYEGAVWWLHIQFTPVDGEDGVFEVTDISDGRSLGDAHPLDIPDGGFVYALNTGNNWPQLIKDHPGEYDDRASDPNYITKTCDAMIAVAATWKKGDKFIFTGLDLENAEDLPTSTPDYDWWEKDDQGNNLYVSTATYTKVG